MGENLTIGFIGTGVMGRSMAGHLLAAGHSLRVYNRTKAKTDSLVDAGAVWCQSPAEAAKGSDVVITIVGYPKDVEDTYFGKEGIFSTVRKKTVLVDMTTSSPELARRIAEEADRHGCAALDAPVSGGDVGAREGRLSIMVGGDKDAYDAALPLFEKMGKTIVHQGPAGSGQYCKMANQIVIASTMMGVCEAMAYAKEAGLAPEVVLESIGSGAAGSWSLSNLAPRMLKKDFAPGFYVKHFIKDLRIALESAKKLGLQLYGLEKALELYKRLSDEGSADDGTQALFRLYLKS